MQADPTDVTAEGRRPGDRRARRPGDRRGSERAEAVTAVAPAGDAGGTVDGPSPGLDAEREAGRGRRSGSSRALLAVVLIALALVGYYVVTLVQVWSTGRSDQARSVDAIVVLGAAQYDGRPSPQLAARLDHAVELWPQGHAPVVIVTGGNQPGDRFTEAESSAGYLIDRGVPAESSLLEDRGGNTYESLELVAGLLPGRGERVLIVTDPYHALRSRLIAEELGLTAYVSPTSTSVVTGGESLRRHLLEAGGVAAGRIIGFDRLSRLT